MKHAMFSELSAPAAVIEIVEKPDPVPGHGKVRVRHKLMTINPADVLMVQDGVAPKKEPAGRDLNIVTPPEDF